MTAANFEILSFFWPALVCSALCADKFEGEHRKKDPIIHSVCCVATNRETAAFWPILLGSYSYLSAARGPTYSTMFKRVQNNCFVSVVIYLFLIFSPNEFSFSFFASDQFWVDFSFCFFVSVCLDHILFFLAYECFISKWMIAVCVCAFLPAYSSPLSDSSSISVYFYFHFSLLHPLLYEKNERNFDGIAVKMFRVLSRATFDSKCRKTPAAATTKIKSIFSTNCLTARLLLCVYRCFFLSLSYTFTNSKTDSRDGSRYTIFQNSNHNKIIFDAQTTQILHRCGHF